MTIEENTLIFEKEFELIEPSSEPIFNIKLWKHKTKSNIFAWNLQKYDQSYKVMFVNCEAGQIKNAAQTAASFLYKTEQELETLINLLSF